MIVSEKHNIIILNPPKTGTWFREKLLLEYNNKYELNFERKEQRHINLMDLARCASSVLDKNLESYKILTFCRNPWERAASWLQMLKNRDQKFETANSTNFLFPTTNSETF